MLKFDGDHEATQPYFETAVAMAPDDPYIQLDFGEFWLNRAANTRLQCEQETYIKRARRSFVNAWMLDDTMPETYAKYGQSYLMEGLNYEKAVEMFEQAARLHPSSVEIRAMLTEAYASVGRNDDAIQQAQLILSWGHEDNKSARLTRSTIARFDRRRNRFGQAHGQFQPLIHGNSLSPADAPAHSRTMLTAAFQVIALGPSRFTA